MIEWKDGKLVSPAMVNEDGTVTPAVYEGNTPLSSYNLNRMQKEIIDDGIIVSATEPITDRRKVWLKNRKNILPTDFNMWVSGQYNSGTGVAENSTVRVRLNSLLKVQAGETYYFNTFSDFAFIIRTYNKDGVFSRNIGGIQNGSTVITNENEGYLGVTLYKPNGTTTYPLYEDYRTLFANKTIKPMICLNCEDKSYIEYIEPTIYIKNNNDTYEEFIKKNTTHSNKNESTEDTYSCNYINSSLEIEQANDLLIAQSGYSFLDINIFKQGKHYFGNVVIKKNSGNFTNVQALAVKLTKSVRGFYNKGCFLTNNQYSARDVGYCYIGGTDFYIADHKEKGYNHAKIHIDLVVN